MLWHDMLFRGDRYIVIIVVFVFNTIGARNKPHYKYTAGTKFELEIT